MRGIAKKAGYKLNEYGLFKGERKTPCKSEEDIFFQARHGITSAGDPRGRGGRGGRGENAGPGGRENDIRGTLPRPRRRRQDGDAPRWPWPRKTRVRLRPGIADRSRSARYAGGLDAETDVEAAQGDRRPQRETVRADPHPKGIEERHSSRRLARLPFGPRLSFDFVIASIHSKFNMTEAEATGKRLVKAMKNKHVTMLGHPTGRLLTSRGRGIPWT